MLKLLKKLTKFYLNKYGMYQTKMNGAPTMYKDGGATLEKSDVASLEKMFNSSSEAEVDYGGGNGGNGGNGGYWNDDYLPLAILPVLNHRRLRS